MITMLQTKFDQIHIQFDPNWGLKSDSQGFIPLIFDTFHRLTHLKKRIRIISERESRVSMPPVVVPILIRAEFVVFDA